MEDYNLIGPGYPELINQAASRIENDRMRAEKAQKEAKRKSKMAEERTKLKERKLENIHTELARMIIREAEDQKVSHLLSSFDDRILSLIKTRAIERLARDSQKGFLSIAFGAVRDFFRSPIKLVFGPILLAVYSLILGWVILFLDIVLSSIAGFFNLLVVPGQLIVDLAWVFGFGAVLMLCFLAYVGCWDITAYRRNAARIHRLVRKNHGYPVLIEERLRAEIHQLQHPPSSGGGGFD